MIEIKEDYLMEMARVGQYKNYEVIIWTNDNGKVPHFHLRDSNTHGEEFHTCICINEAKYFLHTGKEDKLNAKGRRELSDFLNSKSNAKRFESFTNWQIVLTLWNMNNSDVLVDEDLVMPDYTKLK